tara:strand:+ start:4588 stop:5949 length:1362 start_codon:yes stop_codon:yes gene_type:complete
MAYQPLSKLISQAPITKELHITTDNWPVERKKLKDMVRDPRHVDFNWWFWSGVSSKTDLQNFIKDYKEVSNTLMKFKSMKENEINSWFNGKIDNRVHQELISRSIYQIGIDTPRNIGTFPGIFNNEDVITRILYTAYSQRYISMESYSQTDIYTLLLICKIIENIPKKQIDIYKTKETIGILKEALAYSILVKLLDLKISSLYVFPSTIKIKDTTVDLVKKKNKDFLLHNFFKFLFTSMFIKFIDDKDVKNSILLSKDKKEIFSFMCDTFHVMSWTPHPFLSSESTDLMTFIKDYTEIIGNTLVDNDLITYMIHIIAYWCKYFKKKHISNLSEPVEANKSPFLQLEFYGIVGKNIAKDVYDNPIPKSKVEEIRNYLLKKLKKLDGSIYTKLEEIIKLARKKKTNKKYKNGMPINFKFPNKLFNEKQKGGRRKTVKNRSNLRKRTVKNSNYLFL